MESTNNTIVGDLCDSSATNDSNKLQLTEVIDIDDGGIDSSGDHGECAVPPLWRLELSVDIPQWVGIHDLIRVYKRVSREG